MTLHDGNIPTDLPCTDSTAVSKAAIGLLCRALLMNIWGCLSVCPGYAPGVSYVKVGLATSELRKSSPVFSTGARISALS